MQFSARVVLIAAVTGIAGAQQPRSPSTPGFDSLEVRRLIDEAIVSAGKAKSADRPSLFAAAARVQIASGDFTGAERTVALSWDAWPSDVLRQLDLPEWFAMLDHADAARRLVCALHEAKRPDDALSVIRRLPKGPQRDWLLAHEAQVLIGAARVRDSVTFATKFVVERGRAALAIARGVELPEARLDALLGVMNLAPDTGEGASILRDAYAAARRIRLGDADRQASRNALLAEQAFRARRAGDVEALFEKLTDAQDLEYVLGVATDRHGSGIIARRIAPRVIEAGRRIIDSAARASYLGGVHERLRQSLGDEPADALVPEARIDKSRVRRPGFNPRDSALAASTLPEDVARRALDRGDYAEVRRQVERIALGTARGSTRRAQLWSNLSWGIYVIAVDTAKEYARLGREALRRSRNITPADSAEYDEAAASIADRQLWFGDAAGAVETLNLIRDPGRAAAALHDWGASTLLHVTEDSARMYADRLSDPRVRDALLARVVQQFVGTNLRWARALADSIVTPRPRLAARFIVAHATLQQRDTAGARRALAALLADSRAEDGGTQTSILNDLVGAKGWREAESWAEAATTDARETARRLIAVAASLGRELQIQRNGPYYNLRLGNGPDACLDTF